MKKLFAYIAGFVLSIILTLIAFGLDQIHVWSDHTFPTHETMVPVLVALAVLQLFVQLILFLHIGKEERPRWNLQALVFAAFVIIVLVGGTLWIMSNLSHGQHGSLEQIYEGGEISPYTQDD
jgi:cytochrome o ubiquinol oxidase operon protein cyoD